MATDNNYVQLPGAVNVYPGGGGAALPTAPTGPNQSLTSSEVNGAISVAWTQNPGTVTSGAAATKGQFTLSAGTHTQIATTAITASSVIAFTTVSLGTVTIAQAMNAVLASGVGFTPSSASASDTSIVNWAIVA